MEFAVWGRGKPGSGNGIYGRSGGGGGGGSAGGDNRQLPAVLRLNERRKVYRRENSRGKNKNKLNEECDKNGYNNDDNDDNAPNAPNDNNENNANSLEQSIVGGERNFVSNYSNHGYGG